MARAVSGAGWTGLVLLGWLALGCERHVQLKFPDTSPGAQYVCSGAGKREEKCAPRTNVNPADDNRSGTAALIMPRACQGQFNEITVHDSGSSEPVVHVTCAAPENRVK